MKANLLARVADSFASVYRRVLGEEMGPEAKTFLRHLYFVTIGSGVAALLTFAFGVFGGRILGPDAYGQFALVASAADFMQIPMILGFSTAMIRFMSATPQAERQSGIAATAYLLIMVCAATASVVLLLFRNQLASLLAVPVGLYYFAVALAVMNVFWVAIASTQRGMGRMKAYAVVQPIYGVILLAGFFLFASSGMRSFKTMAFSQALAYLLAGIISLISLGSRHLRVAFDRPTAATLSRYAFFALFAGMFSAIYTNVGKILISRYMTLADVGIYSAYYSPSLNVAALLFITFNSVFFPAASRYRDKGAIFRKVDRLIPYMIIIGTPTVFVLEFVILKLYGGKYPLDPVLMLVFAVTAILIVWYGICASTFNSEGLRGVKMTNVSVGTIAVVDLVLSFLLIPRLGLLGAAGSTGLAFGAGILCLQLLRRKLLGSGSDPAGSSVG
jgi:O-antigen/teichoic acid export membrane protein